ncbi:TPA: hypothetical protein ACH3X3_006626 [Trebouxia sp. C0006]
MCRFGILACHVMMHMISWACFPFDVAFSGGFGGFPLTPEEKMRSLVKIHTRAAPGKEDQEWRDFMARMKETHRGHHHWSLEGEAYKEAYMDKRCYHCQ